MITSKAIVLFLLWLMPPIKNSDVPGIWITFPGGGEICCYQKKNEGRVLGYREPGNRSAPLDYAISLKDDGLISVQRCWKELDIDHAGFYCWRTEGRWKEFRP